MKKSSRLSLRPRINPTAESALKFAGDGDGDMIVVKSADNLHSHRHSVTVQSQWNLSDGKGERVEESCVDPVEWLIDGLIVERSGSGMRGKDKDAVGSKKFLELSDELLSDLG